MPCKASEGLNPISGLRALSMHARPKSPDRLGTYCRRFKPDLWGWGGLRGTGPLARSAFEADRRPAELETESTAAPFPSA